MADYFNAFLCSGAYGSTVVASSDLRSMRRETRTNPSFGCLTPTAPEIKIQESDLTLRAFGAGDVFLISVVKQMLDDG
jgi:hypothetical protein